MRWKVFGGALFGAAAFVSAAGAQTPCGGAWGDFIAGVAREARSEGVPTSAINAILSEARQSRSILAKDRSQSAFKQNFLKFSANRISTARIRKAANMRQRYARVFARAQRDFGVPPEVILAFWAMETDFGSFMGKFPIIPSIATLAHDCRRPEIFRPQLIAAMKLVARGDLNPKETGAWAGEVGHVQVLPTTILSLGVDGDGDGRVDVKRSAADAILTAAALLADEGWRRGEPWIVEVTTPQNFDWSLSGFGGERSVSEWRRLGVKIRSRRQAPSGLSAALLLPQGHKGPKFLAFRNFSQVYLEWNQSLINTLTAAYLANRISGEPRFVSGKPDAGLSVPQMKTLQRKLQRLGYDVGKVDGVLGAKTRAAVRRVQAERGLPADGWPTRRFAAGL